ncbi:hypothetical protein Tco_1229849 [Tanacetum coccineum]
MAESFGIATCTSLPTDGYLGAGIGNRDVKNSKLISNSGVVTAALPLPRLPADGGVFLTGGDFGLSAFRVLIV